MMNNVFYFILKAFFVKSFCLNHTEKLLYKKAKVNFKIYDFTNWIANNYNKHIARYFQK